MTLRTVLFLEDEAAYASHLKRLALFFDEIYFIPPTYLGIDISALKAANRVKPDGLGGHAIHDFNFFRDCTAQVQAPPGTLPSPLRDTLQYLIEVGIAKPIPQLPRDEARLFTTAKNLVIYRDANDRDFARLSATTEADYDLSGLIEPRPFQLLADDGRVLSEFLAVNEPNAMRDSRMITTACYHADRLGGFPLLVGERFRHELSHKYSQRGQHLEQLSHLLPADVLNAMLSESDMADVAFNLSSAIFESFAVDEVPIDRLVRYRAEMSTARELFVTGNLFELAERSAAAPWSVKTKRDVTKYLHGKLQHDLKRFDAEATVAWEAFFGKAASHTARVLRAATVAGATGGLVASLLPNTTAGQMVILAALAAIGQQLPDIAEALVGRLLEIRQRQRTGIAYVAGLRRLSSAG